VAIHDYKMLKLLISFAIYTPVILSHGNNVFFLLYYDSFHKKTKTLQRTRACWTIIWTSYFFL